MDNPIRWNCIQCLSFIGIFFLSTSLFAKDLQVHTKLWLTGTFIGPLTEENKKLKYYLDSRLRLIDDTYILDQDRVYAGLGYEVTPNFTPFICGAYIINESTSGVITHEYRIFEQFIWNMIHNSSLSLSNRTRLEERRDTNQSQWAYRLREQFTLKIPFKRWKKYSFLTFDEVFLNLNYPQWVDHRFFAENRAFVGIERTISKAWSFDVGYINQYQFSTPNKMSNGIYLAINMNA